MTIPFVEALDDRIRSLMARRDECRERLAHYQTELGKIDAEIRAYEHAKELYADLPTEEPPTAKRARVQQPVFNILRDHGQCTEGEICDRLPGLPRASIHEFLTRGLRSGIVVRGARPDLFDLPGRKEAAE